jgi:hypothetical protein
MQEGGERMCGNASATAYAGQAWSMQAILSNIYHFDFFISTLIIRFKVIKNQVYT